MQHDTRPSRSPQREPRSAADDLGEPMQHDDSSTTAPAHTKQTELDKREKRKHDASEDELPSTQEKNPVPPDATRP